jgi:predicted TIM-barrel fold metal-dependent hydrolase
MSVVIDGHCHVWPDAIAERALSSAAPELRRFGDGKASTLLETMAVAGVDRSVCLGVASTPDQVEAANRFAGSLAEPKLIGFGSIHPALGVDESLASLRRYHLRGVKVHPLFQGYALDDSGLIALLDAMQQEFVVVIHVGKGGKGSERCTPRMLRDLAIAVPRLDIIACHLGGYLLLDEAADLVVGLPNVYLDTSWPPSIGVLSPARVRGMIERHGAERVVFASDWPMADPGAEIAALTSLGLRDDDLEGVLGGNLQRLIG